MQRGGYTLKMRERGGKLIALMTLHLGNDVNIRARATVSQSALASIMNKSFRGSFGGMAGADEELPEEELMGWFGSKIFKKIKKVAKSVAKNKVFKVAKKIFRNPVFKGVAMAIPGVNVAVGALTAADIAMQAAAGIAKMYKSGRGAVKQARGAARGLKRQAWGQAKRRGVPAAQFKRAWRSGWGAVPNPRLVTEIQRYRGNPAARQMFYRTRATARRGYGRQLPSFIRSAAMNAQQRGCHC